MNSAGIFCSFCHTDAFWIPLNPRVKGAPAEWLKRCSARGWEMMPLDLRDSRRCVLCFNATMHHGAWFYIARLASFNFKISNCFPSTVTWFLSAAAAAAAAVVLLASRPSKNWHILLHFREVDKSIHQKILCGETQSRKVMSAGKEQIKLALN